MRNCRLVTTNGDKVVMVWPNVTMDCHQALLQCAARLVRGLTVMRFHEV